MRGNRRALLAGLAAVVVICFWPVTTRTGVNFTVTAYRVTFAEKAVHFVSRHWQTRRLARAVADPSWDFERKVTAISQWVDAHVRPVPEGFPVVDDHPLHIILRGYGAPDQRSEAFALIASTVGLPSATAVLTPPGSREKLMLAFVLWKGDLYPVDVVHQIIFRTPEGRLATSEELQQHPEWIAAAAKGRVIDGYPYLAYWHDLGSLDPSFERMRLQRPWSRFWMALGKALRLGAKKEK